MSNFRPATTADVDLIVRFMRGLYAHDQIPFQEKEAKAALENLMASPEFGRVWLILRDGGAVGYLVITFGYSLEFHGRDGFVDELFLCEEARGKGLGTMALRFAEASCRALGLRALHLEVNRANVAAQRVYRRAGYYDHDRYLMTRRLVAEELR